ncbi:MAG: cell envelope biogenesis protein TolA [Sphingobium sp.]|uniref:cell envelope biogenesis protein TolA n=1 Tax=Sphingobium sp. TaxID=1912891 RepID=UPI0029AB284B|nr:cell envelope biogenesis protein TolA [Sphingobium sp.]MDX3909924.1 cell envelope biogenesis protein TolA [Sphingobium sp.]
MERSEKIGFGIATAVHVLLFSALSTGFLTTPNPLKLNSPPMDVSLVDEVALRSAAPEISRQPPPPSVAPEVGETAEPAPSEPAPSEPEVAPPPPPKPTPPTPKPVPKPAPATRPVERAKPKPPAPKPAPEKAKPAKVTPPAERAKPAPAKAKPAPAKSTPSKAQAKPAPAKPAAATGKGKADRPRGSQLGPDFLKGIESEAAPSPAPAAPAASVVGAKQKAALDGEIRRQLKPHWKAPTGADAEKLRTIVAVELTRSGAISGSPEVVDTTGVTASNRAQVKLHQELAVKAIRLAAPFKLPPDLYDGWKSLRIAFDKRLSQ